MYIVIVSICGRGQWLALELKRLGYYVILVDLEHETLNFTSEDIEPPFGIFKNHLFESYIDRLEDESSLLHAENGFTIWLKNSNLEFRGSISKFQFKTLNINRETIDYIKNPKEKPKEFDFNQNWLAHLAHQISSTTFKTNINGLNDGTPAKLFDPFYFRLNSRRGMLDFKNKLKKSGIEIYSSIDDLDISSKTLNINNKFIQYKDLIWMLSSYETDQILPKLRDKIFTTVTKPTWYWIRYKIYIEPEVAYSLPSHFVNLKDIYLPWSYENLMIVQKTVNIGELNCWLRLPSRYSDKDYMLYANKIRQTFLEKINKKVRITGVPKQQNLNIFPIYDKKLSVNTKIILDSPEIWDSLSWNGQCISNMNTIDAINTANPSNSTELG